MARISTLIVAGLPTEWILSHTRSTEKVCTTNWIAEIAPKDKLHIDLAGSGRTIDEIGNYNSLAVEGRERLIRVSQLTSSIKDLPQCPRDSWPSTKAQTYSIDQAMVVVGRHPACDARLDSLRTSRRHCCLTQENGEIFVRDLGSTNGIRINGQRVEIGRLQRRRAIDRSPPLSGRYRPGSAAVRSATVHSATVGSAASPRRGPALAAQSILLYQPKLMRQFASGMQAEAFVHRRELDGLAGGPDEHPSGERHRLAAAVASKDTTIARTHPF